uniref:glucoamylase family protein n=1 Tax=Deinococcus sp. TaxID=47478 RepID=UPI002869C8D4
YTSPTNIGAYLWSTLAARDHGVISASDAHARMAAILTTLSGMERHHGFFLNWYKPADATPVTIWPTDGNVVAPFLSTVDNAWLAVGLIMVKNADPGLKAQAGALLDSMNWGFFYDRSKGHLYGGYTVSGAQNTSPETKITLSSSGAALGDLQTASTLSLQVYVPAGTTLAPNSFFVGMADTTGGGFNWVDGTFAGQTLHPSWNTVNLGVPQAWKTLNPAQTYTLYFSFFNETAGVKTPLQSGFNLGAATLDTPAGPTAFSLWNSATAASFGNDHTGAVVTADAGVLTPGGQPSLQVAPVSAGQYTDFAYGALNTEPRIASYLGLARGQLPKEHYFKLYRTFPTDWEQEQTPTGVTRTYEGVNVYEGAYSYGGVKMVPSWGGSMFEALMVPEFVPETEWAPQSWGKNHDNYVKAQIYHGLNDARYGYWGFSPSNKPEGGYSEYGVDAIGIKADGYASNNDKTLWNPVTPPDAAAYTNGVVTPHASFLALQFEPNAAMKNLRNLEKDFNVYGKYGYFDSVNVQTKVVSSCVLALDQGMIMSALGNWFLGDHYRNYLADDLRPVVQPLIRQERFSIP